MKLHDIKPAAGSRRKKVRRGRGDSSGAGSFSGRGCKGQNSRSGGGVRLGFEGGQTPLLRRTPKLRGFKNPCRIEYRAINLYILEDKFADGDKVTPETLVEKGVVSSVSTPVKILGQGELTKKLTFEGVVLSKSVASKLGVKQEVTEKKEPKKKK
jgi:large subunit ribosomal protein L15